MNVGDTVRMVNTAGFKISDNAIAMLPHVTVLEIKPCEDGNMCALGNEVFRFTDPVAGEDDWMHTSEFEVVEKKEEEDE